MCKHLSYVTKKRSKGWVSNPEFRAPVLNQHKHLSYAQVVENHGSILIQNIKASYRSITRYYQLQPPTKAPTFWKWHWSSRASKARRRFLWRPNITLTCDWACHYCLRLALFIVSFFKIIFLKPFNISMGKPGGHPNKTKTFSMVWTLEHSFGFRLEQTFGLVWTFEQYFGVLVRL